MLAMGENMNKVETIVYPKWLIPVESNTEALLDHAIAVNNGKIEAILPAAEMRQQYQTDNEVILADHMLIPGFVNTHTHTPMNLLRCYADDLGLMDWLNNHIWPAERKALSENAKEFIQLGTLHAIAEMIKSGTTCFNDMYFFPEHSAEVAIDVGMRATFSLPIMKFPMVWAETEDEYISKGKEVFQAFRDQPLLRFTFAPHSLYATSDHGAEQAAQLAEEFDTQIHVHMHESEEEIKQSMEETGLRPFARLQKVGAMNSRLIAVHVTQLNDDDCAMLAESGAHVVTCPESNLKLASGFCETARLHAAGINVAIGTDGAASNNNLDMIEEMHITSLLAKAVSKDPLALDANLSLQMATLNGAKALARDNEIGSLKVGKAADMVAINLNNIATRPQYNPVSLLVYSASREQVTDVWVNGKAMLRNRELTFVDEKALFERIGNFKI